MDFVGAGVLTAFAATDATGVEATACGAGFAVSTTVGAFTVPADPAAEAEMLRVGAVSAPFPSPRFISLTKLGFAAPSFAAATLRVADSTAFAFVSDFTAETFSAATDAFAGLDLATGLATARALDLDLTSAV